MYGVSSQETKQTRATAAESHFRNNLQINVEQIWTFGLYVVKNNEKLRADVMSVLQQVLVVVVVVVVCHVHASFRFLPHNDMNFILSVCVCVCASECVCVVTLISVSFSEDN